METTLWLAPPVFESYKYQMNERSVLLQLQFLLQFRRVLFRSKAHTKEKVGVQKQIGRNPGSIRNVQNQLTRENRQNYFGHKIQLQKILAMLGAIPVERSRKRSVITSRRKLTGSRKTVRTKTFGKCIRGLLKSTRLCNKETRWYNCSRYNQHIKQMGTVLQ